MVMGSCFKHSYHRRRSSFVMRFRRFCALPVSFSFLFWFIAICPWRNGLLFLSVLPCGSHLISQRKRCQLPLKGKPLVRSLAATPYSCFFESGRGLPWLPLEGKLSPQRLMRWKAGHSLADEGLTLSPRWNTSHINGRTGRPSASVRCGCPFPPRRSPSAPKWCRHP